MSIKVKKSTKELKRILTRKFLIKEYYLYNKTDKQIAKELDIHPCNIQRYRKKLEIKSIPHGLRMRGRKASDETKAKMRESARRAKYLVRSGNVHKCEVCGKERYFPLWLERKTKSFTCSLVCAIELRRIKSGKDKNNFGNILCICVHCGKEFYRQACRTKNKKYLLCSRKCQQEYQRGKPGPMFGRKCPETSKRMKENNPMFKKDIVEKVRQKAIGRINKPLDQQVLLKKYYCKVCGVPIHARTGLYGDGYCKKHAHSGERNCNFGKTITIKQCKYNKVWFKSSWEANFAKWCDLSGIKWKYELKAFPLTINKKKTNYIPDFYLPEFDCWIEIKGLWRKDAKKKFDEFCKLNLNVDLFDKDKLKQIGVI